MISRFTIVAGATILLLLSMLVYQLIAPVAPIAEPVAPSRPTTARLVPLPSFNPPPPEQFAAINARAAFDPARQPVAEATQLPLAAVRPNVTLAGVVAGGGDAVALLHRPTGQTISIRMGESVDGWQLVRVAPGLVVFRAGTTDYTLPLRAAAGLAQPSLNNGSPPPSTDKPGP